MLKKTIVAAAVLIASVGPAAAASTSEQLALCVSALEQRGVSTGDYRARFKGVRGGGTKQLAIRMEPRVDGKEPMDVVCSIRRGEVVAVAGRGPGAVALN
ncbi:MAG: hypothetical protein AAGC56_08295 [Pseudomonadota bacterium]